MCTKLHSTKLNVQSGRMYLESVSLEWKTPWRRLQLWAKMQTLGTPHPCEHESEKSVKAVVACALRCVALTMPCLPHKVNYFHSMVLRIAEVKNSLVLQEMQLPTWQFMWVHYEGYQSWSERLVTLTSVPICCTVLCAVTTCITITNVVYMLQDRSAAFVVAYLCNVIEFDVYKAIHCHFVW